MDTDLLSMGFGLGALLLVLAIGILFYVVNSLALHTIANNRGSDKGWFAWVPILNGFLIPILVENDVTESLRGRFTTIYLATLLLSLIPFVGFVFSVLSVIISVYALYVLLSQYTENVVMYFVVTVLTLGTAMPFLLFRIRNREVIA